MDEPRAEVVSAEEAQARGLREGVEKSSEVGSFEVSMWWPKGATGGPQELVIRPKEDADPEDIARGITTTTLRRIPLTEETDAVRKFLLSMESTMEKMEADSSIERLKRIVMETPNPGRMGRADEFYLWVAMAYIYLSRWADNPTQQLSEATGAGLSSVKTWVRTARQIGILSEGKSGGRLTEKGEELRESL